MPAIPMPDLAVPKAAPAPVGMISTLPPGAQDFANVHPKIIWKDKLAFDPKCKTCATQTYSSRNASLIVVSYLQCPDGALD